MKTKEFIRRVRELGFRTEKEFANIAVYKDGCEVALVEPDKMYGIVSGINDYHELPSETQNILFNLLVEYASTPVEERKEEKKYYIRFKHITNISPMFSDINRNYLNYQKEEEKWALNSKFDNYHYKTQFTLAELPDWVHEMLEQGHLVKEEVE